MLNDAIKAGGSSLRDHRQTDGELGYFQHHFRVYDREGEACPTPGCSGMIRRIVQGTALDVLLSGLPEVRCLSFTSPRLRREVDARETIL